MSAKLCVNVDVNWDSRLIMDNKDFTALCEILDRATHATHRYLENGSVVVRQGEVKVSAELFKGQVLTIEAFNEMK
jgi:hypothetical protein